MIAVKEELVDTDLPQSVKGPSADIIGATRRTMLSVTSSLSIIQSQRSNNSPLEDRETPRSWAAFTGSIIDAGRRALLDLAEIVLTDIRVNHLLRAELCEFCRS